METLTQPNPVKHAEKALFKNQQVSNGLNQDYSEAMANELNVLLSSMHMFYANTRAYHWKIQGKQFFTLHEKFEELYDDLALKADEVAERILSLDAYPVHKLSEFGEKSLIQETEGPTDAIEAVNEILKSLSSLIQLERDLISMAGDNNDVTTEDQLTGYLAEHEKLMWMFKAFTR